MLSCFLQGCRKHVYHTYYGDIDIDTMTIAFHQYGKDFYRVRYSEKDSFNWDGEWKYISGPIIDYYCPDSNVYVEMFKDNDGNMIGNEMDPYHNMDWLNN